MRMNSRHEWNILFSVSGLIVFGAIVGVQALWAAQPFESLDWWRKTYKMPDCRGVSVVVLEVESVEDSLKALSKECAKGQCRPAEHPHWYYTAVTELRTHTEPFFAMSPEHAAAFKKRALRLGKVLQAHEVQGPTLSPKDLEEIGLKQKGLSGELKVLTERRTKIPGTLALVEWELGYLERLLAADRIAREVQLVTVRLKSR